jgi:glycosyltransferase involved in cell wall biosynthesis
MNRQPSPCRVLLGFDFHAKYAAGLAMGLRQAGWEPLLLRRDHDLEFGGVSGEQDAYIRQRLGSSVRSAVVPGRVRSVAAVPELRRLRRLVRDYRPEVVHLQESVTNDPRLPLLARARPGRYAVTRHDPTLHPGDQLERARIRLAQRSLIGGAGLIFVHAAVLGDELRRHYRVRAPVVVVPHGAEVSPCPAPGDPRTVLFFGRVSFYKGLDVLLDAMQLVWEQVPGARVVAAGEGDWPHHPALQDPRVEARAEHVPENDVRQLFCRAGCVVLPYRQASQSGVGSLARQFGRALVVTSVGGLPELVTDATGRVVPPESPTVLAAALVNLMQSQGTLEAMGRAATRELQEASWTRVGELTAEAYERHLLRRPLRRVPS